MVKHVLFVKLKENTPEQCEKVKSLFLSMKDKVPMVRDIAVGIDYLHSERSYDVVLELVVDDREALEAYQVDPYHAGVVKPYIAEVRDGSTIVVDYEF
ncbi:MAG: Dabb family protein [Oscillospiraceae bacterium]|nr:Dabb family protein [Oscillospiraceae bacterium]